MPPSIHHLVDFQRHGSPRALGDANGGIAGINFVNNPVRIESFIRQQGLKFDPLNEGRNPDCIEAISGQKLEAHEVAERVCEGQNFSCPTSL